MKCKMYLFVAILENGRHLGFLIGQSYRMDLISIEMSNAKVRDCITICTIHPKKSCNTYCSTVSVTTYPKASVTTCPNVISLTKFVIVDKYGHLTSNELYTGFCIHITMVYVYVHNIMLRERENVFIGNSTSWITNIQRCEIQNTG